VTTEPTQLDRIEAKLDELLQLARPVEVESLDIGPWTYRPPRRRWWHRNRNEPTLQEIQDALEELNSKHII
jgi:2'-5' RNA ligase